MKEIKSNNFKESVLDSEGIVLVDFSATWCGPCKMQKPVLEKLDEDSDFPIYSLDVDLSPDVAGKYNVNAVPTLIFFKDGKLAETLVGFQAREAIEKTVENLRK